MAISEGRSPQRLPSFHAAAGRLALHSSAAGRSGTGSFPPGIRARSSPARSARSRAATADPARREGATATTSPRNGRAGTAAGVPARPLRSAGHGPGQDVLPGLVPATWSTLHFRGVPRRSLRVGDSGHGPCGKGARGPGEAAARVPLPELRADSRTARAAYAARRAVREQMQRIPAGSPIALAR